MNVHVVNWVLICLISALATPTTSSDSWLDVLFRLLLPCETISFTQKAGYTATAIMDQEANTCNTVANGTPSTIALISRPANCSYKFIGFSGLGCQDDKVVKRHPLNSNNSTVTVNERKTICSFKLGHDVPHGRSVHVKFGGNSVSTLTQQVSQQQCRNLCNASYQSYHPHWVGVYDEANNIVEDNHVELFTNHSCADGSEIQLANGTTAIRFEYLDALTLIHPNQLVGSFFISEEVGSN